VSSALARLRLGGIERRNLGALVYAAIGLGAVGFVAVRVAMGVMSGVRRLFS